MRLLGELCQIFGSAVNSITIESLDALVTSNNEGRGWSNRKQHLSSKDEAAVFLVLETGSFLTSRKST